MSNSNSFTRHLSLCKQSLKSRLPQIATILLAALVTTSSLAGPGDEDPGKKSTARKGGAGGGNGGDADEINFKIKLQKIVRFLGSPEGQKAFPEINPREFSESVDRVTVKVSDTEVKDNFGNTRTCAWDRQAWKISCNRARLNLAGVSPEVQFTLIMHEMLGLMGLEEGNQEDPSLYTYSSRLIPYVQQVVDYDLNRGSRSYSLIERGMSCHEKAYPTSFLGLKKYYVVSVERNGYAALWKVSEPKGYDDAFRTQCLDCNDLERKQHVLKKLGLIPKAKLVSYGQIERDRFVRMKGKKSRSGYFIDFGTTISSPQATWSQYAGKLEVDGKTVQLTCFAGGDQTLQDAEDWQKKSRMKAN